MFFGLCGRNSGPVSSELLRGSSMVCYYVYPIQRIDIVENGTCRSAVHEGECVLQISGCWLGLFAMRRSMFLTGCIVLMWIGQTLGHSRQSRRPAETTRRSDPRPSLIACYRICRQSGRVSGRYHKQRSSGRPDVAKEPSESRWPRACNEGLDGVVVDSGVSLL